MADTSFHEAEAVIDEVALLEAALREAVERRRTAAFDSPTTKFDAAVASYGVQLRAWVDLQVDSRLQQVLHGLIECELMPARHDGAAALGASERLEREVGAVAEAQAKLLTVVEGISIELARLKAAVAACQLGAQLNTAVHGNSNSVREEALATVEKVMASVDELKRSVARERGHDDSASQLARHEASLAELWKSHERHTAKVSDFHRLQGSKVEQREVHLELESMTASHADLEKRFEAQIETLRSERTSALNRESLLEELRGQLEESQARFGDELVSLQQRLVAELRAETTAAFRSEAAAVAALDEQLWLTDQRLGQRIDELAHLQLRERIAVAERHGGGSGRDTGNVVKKRGSGLLSMASVAAENVMEAVDAEHRHSQNGKVDAEYRQSHSGHGGRGSSFVSIMAKSLVDSSVEDISTDRRRSNSGFASRASHGSQNRALELANNSHTEDARDEITGEEDDAKVRSSNHSVLRVGQRTDGNRLHRSEITEAMADGMRVRGGDCSAVTYGASEERREGHARPKRAGGNVLAVAAEAAEAFAEGAGIDR